MHPPRNTAKEHYEQLRGLPHRELWEREVPLFDQGDARQRLDRVAVIRAVGVAFSRFGTPEEKAMVRAWLVPLLRDPQEKIRRYAMAALPKLGAGASEEAALLEVLKASGQERERAHVARSLDKIGGSATLEALSGTDGVPRLTELKVRAAVARREEPSSLPANRVLADSRGVRVILRCRRGLEAFVREEVVQHLLPERCFRLAGGGPGWVELSPSRPFQLADLLGVRCFATIAFPLGTVPGASVDGAIDPLATRIVSPLSRRILSAFTEGSVRYRLDIVGRGHQRGAIRRLADRAYALCPEILNDAKLAPWSVDIRETGREIEVELRPRLYPDPRFSYREDDVAAASHPPLAAAMARLAGPWEGERVWDPFCGSGLELIERARLGGVSSLFGSDLSEAALAITRANLASAGFGELPAVLGATDFREFARHVLERAAPSLIITNPPLGRRVRVPNLHGLFDDLFAVAARVLAPGGRLVLTNPFRLDRPPAGLRLEYRQPVDLGGFECRLEKYVRAGSVR